MQKVSFKGRVIQCSKGEKLRDVLLKNHLSPHNKNARFINCHGMGTCGTCAVKIIGEIPNINKREKWRLNFPPHKKENGLRLACQVKVMNDLTVKKGKGFWGQNI